MIAIPIGDICACYKFVEYNFDSDVCDHLYKIVGLHNSMYTAIVFI